jgi:carbon starvation protein CstA
VLDAGTQINRFIMQKRLNPMLPQTARADSWTKTVMTSGLIVGA